MRNHAFMFAVIAFVGGVAASYGCAAKEVEAEAKYGGMQYDRCVKPEPVLGTTASRETRLAAWDRVDKCRAQVRAEWGIVETVTKDAGGDQ